MKSTSFLFIDDSEFERNEVENVLPHVRTFDAAQYLSILDMEELNIPITAESKKRKQFYLDEINRKVELESFNGKYFDFLKQCNIKLEISKLKEKNITRVYELTQRTNQMNFSGSRYQKEDVEAILKNKDLDAFVMRCSDVYGDYGVVGFGVVKKSENRLIYLMFSCRIQSKRV
jgi:FkbH-like protein